MTRRMLTRRTLVLGRDYPLPFIKRRTWCARADITVNDSTAEAKRENKPTEKRRELNWKQAKTKEMLPKTSQAQQQQITELKDLAIAKDKKLETQKFAVERLIHELRKKTKKPNNN